MAVTNGSATRPTTTDAVYSIALKIGRTIIKNAGITGKYADFDKAPLDYGGIIEDLKIKLKSSTTYNPSASSFMSAQYDTVIKRYFGSWSPRRYDTEVNNFSAKSVVTGEAQLADFVAKIVNNLTESEVQEANEDYTKLFSDTSATTDTTTLFAIDAVDHAGTNATDISGIITAGAHGFLKAASLYEGFSKPTSDDVLTEIRNIVKDMTYANTTYDGISGTGKHECRLENIRIIANYKWLNDLDVTKLANTFQLEKADMMAKLVETDACEFNYKDTTATTGKITSAHGYVVIICDKDAIGRVVRGKEMETGFVRERFSQWYGMVEDVMTFYNPTEKCWALVFTDVETEA